MHKRLSRIHLPAAGDEINCDYIHQALHHTTVTTTWNSPWLPSYSLWLFGSLLNSSICLLSFTLIFFLSHHSSSPSAPPTRSAFHPFLLLLSSISIWKQSCSLLFHQHRSSVTLIPPCVLPHSILSSPIIRGTTVRRQQSQCSLK